MVTETQMAGVSIWINDRDRNSLWLAQEVDADRNAGDQIRKAFGHFFTMIGGAEDITTAQQAKDWAQKLRVEGRSPEPKMPQRSNEPGHQVMTQVYRPHALGMTALANDYIANTSPEFSELIVLRQKQLDKRGSADSSRLDVLARDCIDDKKISHAYGRVLSWFSAAAIDGYFDMRSQEDGFVTAMQNAAEWQRQALSEGFPSSPVEQWPWGTAR